MIDIHSHILWGIDDGANSQETALEMARIAVGEGITHIIATPHFIAGSIENYVSGIQERCNELTAMLKENEINLSVYPGSELFLSPEIPQLLEEGKIAALNNSRYVLTELPMMSIPDYIPDVLYRIRLNGFIPIIAHPSRNREIMNDPNRVYDLIQSGALMQINASTLTGLYGDEHKEIAWMLLRHNMAHFIATDAHTCRGRAPKLRECRRQVEETIGKEAAVPLFELNGKAVLDSQSIIPHEPRMIQKKKTFIIPSFQHWLGKLTKRSR